MPLPTPNKGEKKSAFISRCMANPVMGKDFPKADQRHAVCQRQWSSSHKSSESKALRMTSDDEQQSLDSMDRAMPDSVDRRAIRRTVVGKAKRLVAALGEIAASVSGGSLTPDEAHAAAIIAMAPIFADAASMGYRATGAVGWEHSDSQIAFLAGLAEAEADYFLAFMRELAPEAMATGQRLRLYGGATESAFWYGFVSTLPSSAVIHWRLGIAEHCQGCLDLAARSPYTKPRAGSNPLPTVPRGGSTPCLSNCRCHLVATGGLEASLFNRIGVELLAIGAVVVDPTSQAAISQAAVYQAMAEDYAYLRRLAYLDPSGPWSGLAAGVLADIEALAASYNQTVRQEASDEEILEPIRDAERIGLVYVPEVTDEMIGEIVAILVSDEVDHGTITDVSAGVVTLDGDRRYTTGRHGRALVFAEGSK